MAETGERPRRLSANSKGSDQAERLEPHLLRAAQEDDVEKLRQILETARARKQLDESFLQKGLIRSSERGKLAATEFLLENGASPDGAAGNRAPPLLKAVERNNIGIVHLLLKHGANPETADKKGRTLLMTAAWKNHWNILELLIKKGANINAKDDRGRNILHNLGADKQCNWGDSVAELLLAQNITIDGEDGRDNLARTPLHWACATGKKGLAEMLLTRPRGPRASVHAVELRGKTPLHLAAAHDREDIVELLLRHNADVMAKSDGSWTPLHNACELGFEKIVRMLLNAGSDPNAKLLNGMTALHYAAQNGHLEVVKCLLERPETKRAVRDATGITPFLKAAQNKHKEIVNLLAPVNFHSISEDALGACNGFNATIVDFGNFRNRNRVKKYSVFELLYAHDPVNTRKAKLTVLPNDKASEFRWIHLPANNMAWIEVLLCKLFIEEGAGDVEGFKALERSFSHQHRGQQSHSHFMRPLCQSTTRTPRVPKTVDESGDSSTEQGPPQIVITSSNAAPKTPNRNPSRQDSYDWSKSSPNHSGKENKAEKSERHKKEKAYVKGNKSPKGNDTPRFESMRRSNGLDSPRPSSAAKKESSQPSGNVFAFMPYLHFETTRRRQEMQNAIRRAETMRSPLCRLGKAETYDEMLIRAHLNTSTVSLHVRRTLDQSFYHNIDTSNRDQDQVVYRYQLRANAEEDFEVDPKIVMVDQLWMYVLGKDLIVTAFPQRWQQPKNDPLNVLDGIIEDINSKAREPVNSVYDLAMVITNRCTGVFDRHHMGDEDYQFLDMFESSIGNATDRETVLFKEFDVASAQASQWLLQNRRWHRSSKLLQHNTAATDINREQAEEQYHAQELTGRPFFVDRLLDIGQETNLLAETKDIRDELNMIVKVFEDQGHVLRSLQEAILDIYSDEQKSQQSIKKRFRDRLKTIDIHIKDIERMDRQAERIYKSVTDMLDLKQKHANVFEARFARDQAEVGARQSQTIMVFTIVTIVFLPLSFIAAFFAINIREFPRGDQGPSLPLGYVSKYLFGIGFAVSIPLIAVALRLDDIVEAWRQFRKWRAMSALKKRFGREADPPQLGSLDVLRIEPTSSLSKSVETDWIRERLSLSSRRPGTARTREEREREQEREKATGFRMRVSQDIERGDATAIRHFGKA
ncbi:related to ankyrin repeat protein [Phialocephala subalpina]|uniref:Related to ankyrin repeat protein n=1 Tax=Phialocephala subalpina TaxID=576137 RepID=A0A1L7WQV0_9HELO|nr:related to ankyrin repeat protein [Phialocephala subalpina]